MAAFTTLQYERLCVMLAKGVTSLEVGNGEKVTYRSLDEMLRLKKLMEADLGINNALPRVHRPAFRRV